MKAKKVLAMLMASAMIMGTSVTAFAAETTNVTVNVGKTYDSFKYIQIVEADPTSTDGWKYVDEYADDFAEITVNQLVNIAKAESQNEHATAGEINDTELYESSKLAEVLEGLRDETGTPGIGTSFSVTEGGLYVIIPEKENYTYSPTMVYVPVNSTEAINVQAKGAPDQVTKTLVNVTGGEIASGDGTIVDGDDSVTANDVVEYKVTMQYPYFSDGATNKTFTIQDTLTNGTFMSNPGVAVTVDGSPASCTVDPITDGETTVITVTFNDYQPTLAGKDVVLTYSVKVDSDVSSENKLSNKVVSTIGTNQTQSIVKSDTVGVEFKKVNTENHPLTGAVFALYEDVAEGDDILVAYIADVKEDDTVTLPDGSASAPVVKDGNANGILTYDGLDANKAYYLKEVIAPDGYSLLSEEYKLVPGAKQNPIIETKEVGGIMTTYTEYQYNDFTVADNNEGKGIINTTLSALPSTGGIGTTIFTIGGCAIMVTAAGLYFATRKKTEK